MSNWPDEFPDPEEIKRIKREQQASWPAPGDMPKAAKPGKGQRPPKEKLRPTWGVPASTGKGEGKPGDGRRGRKTAAPEYAPVDNKAALKRAAEDAAWAARQQKEIAKANKQQARDARAAARDARKAREWQASAEREIESANRGRRGGVVYAVEPEAGGGRRPGCGCLGTFAWLPAWVALLALLLLLADIWINS
jgi:hypothetical protein